MSGAFSTYYWNNRFSTMAIATTPSMSMLDLMKEGAFNSFLLSSFLLFLVIGLSIIAYCIFILKVSLFYCKYSTGSLK